LQFKVENRKTLASLLTESGKATVEITICNVIQPANKLQVDDVVFDVKPAIVQHENFICLSE